MEIHHHSGAFISPPMSRRVPTCYHGPGQGQLFLLDLGAEPGFLESFLLLEVPPDGVTYRWD